MMIQRKDFVENLSLLSRKFATYKSPEKFILKPLRVHKISIINRDFGILKSNNLDRGEGQIEREHGHHDAYGETSMLVLMR